MCHFGSASSTFHWVHFSICHLCSYFCRHLRYSGSWLRGVSAASKFLLPLFWGQLLSPYVHLWHQASRTTEHLYNWNCSKVGHGRFGILDLKSVNTAVFFETKSLELKCLPNSITICGKESIFQTSSAPALQTPSGRSSTQRCLHIPASHPKGSGTGVTNA